MSSTLESRFSELWKLLDGPELEQEYRFHPPRRWRADFAHLPSRTLIEIEGGVWNRGRHLTPKGFLNDADKYLTAALDGWSVLRLTEPQIKPETLRTIIAYVHQRATAQHLEGSMATA